MGIDPGTKSFDFYGMENESVVLNESVPSEEIATNPMRFVEIVKSMEADVIIGPSGYGLPIKRLRDLDKKDFFLLTLVRPEELNSISVLSGMQKSLALLKDEDCPMYFIPGVIHLPTVPVHRKLNKVDMGTADKLCCAALGILDQSTRLGVEYCETSFIMLEMGYGYTSAIAVENGEIVDGVGGTTGSPGYTSIGAMDGELAYLLGSFDKTLLFEGGASSLTEAKMTPERLAGLAHDGNKYTEAWKALMEGAAKDVLQLFASTKPKEVLISGRLTRILHVSEGLRERLEFMAPVENVEGFSKEVKEAAQGAAVIANGLAGGEYKDLVDQMKLKKARGTVLDYIHLQEADALRKRYGII